MIIPWAVGLIKKKTFYKWIPKSKPKFLAANMEVRLNLSNYAAGVVILDFSKENWLS